MVSGAEFKMLCQHLASGFWAVVGVGPLCVQGMMKLEGRAEEFAWGWFVPPDLRQTLWLGWGLCPLL